MSKRVFFDSFFSDQHLKKLLFNKAVILSLFFLLFNMTLSFGNLAIYTPYIYSSLSPFTTTTTFTSSDTMFDNVQNDISTLDSDDSFDGTVPQISLTFYPVNAFCYTGFATTETNLTKKLEYSNFHWSWTLRNNRMKNTTTNLYDLGTSKIINP